MIKKRSNFMVDKILIVAVIAGIFVLAAADNMFSVKTDPCEVVATNILKSCLK